MRHRVQQMLLVISTLWLSWLAMMLVHEGGHVLGAICSGGTVRQVVWHPAVISRTDVRPNPHPLVEVWAGPLAGVLVPVAAAALATAGGVRIAYLLWAVAGFCLIANGAYIGIGALDPIGDARELVAHGTPRWLMAMFGVISSGTGLLVWHRVSPRFGFGLEGAAVSKPHAYGVFVVVLLATLLGLSLGNPGIQDL